MTLGTLLGFSAILLPQLEEENVLVAKSDEASWIGEQLYLFLLNKTLVKREILTRNITIKRHYDNSMIFSHRFLLTKVSS
jgi:hypothetical protein